LAQFFAQLVVSHDQHARRRLTHHLPVAVRTAPALVLLLVPVLVRVRVLVMLLPVRM
jgi:hypothetical protein